MAVTVRVESGEEVQSGETTVPMSVVGESFYQPAIAAILEEAKGVRSHHAARLVPNPDNPYDQYAVEVWVDGRHVGHLFRETAQRYHVHYKGPVEGLEAEITGGEGDAEYYGVVLWVPSLLKDRLQ